MNKTTIPFPKILSHLFRPAAERSLAEPFCRFTDDYIHFNLQYNRADSGKHQLECIQSASAAFFPKHQGLSFIYADLPDCHHRSAAGLSLYPAARRHDR